MYVYSFNFSSVWESLLLFAVIYSHAALLCSLWFTVGGAEPLVCVQHTQERQWSRWSTRADSNYTCYVTVSAIKASGVKSQEEQFNLICTKDGQTAWRGKGAQSNYLFIELKWAISGVIVRIWDFGHITQPYTHTPETKPTRLIIYQLLTCWNDLVSVCVSRS